MECSNAKSFSYLHDIIPFQLECSKTQFQCSDGKCIESSLKCNLQHDCNDGSDEKDCGKNKSNDKD